MCHTLTGCFDFLTGLFVSIKMEERETHIRFRHYDGKTCIGMQTFLPQFLLEDTHRIAHVVATGGKGINVC